jgi:hypothetical protein
MPKMYNAFMLRYRCAITIVIFCLVTAVGFANIFESDIKFDVNPIVREKAEVKLGYQPVKNLDLFSGIEQIIRNNDTTGGILYHDYDSTYCATRLTIPSQVASICSITKIRFEFKYPNPTDNAPCSLFVWRDTVINEEHQPGAVLWHGFYNLDYPHPGYVQWQITFFSPILLNRKEHFWLGAINLNRNINIVSDASTNPEHRRNLRKDLGEEWEQYDNDFYFEAVVRYEPIPNNIGTISINNVDKVLKNNTILSVQTIVKNMGMNPLNPGIPVILNITGPDAYVMSDTEYTNSTLLTNAIELITFSLDWQVPNTFGDYEVAVWTAFALDSMYDDDTTEMSVFVYARGVRETFTTADFPPAGWRVIDYNNDNYWRREIYGSGYYTPPGGAIILYDEYPYWPNNDWLVSPRLHAEPTDSIIFFYRGASSSRTETLLVRLNTNSVSNDTINFIIIDTISTDDFYWYRKVICLSDYLTLTDTIAIAFHYPSFYKFYIAIDDIITPEPIRSIDVFTHSIEAPLLPLVADSTYIPRAKFRNNSIDNSTEFLLVNVYYQVTGDSTNYLDSLTEQIEHGNSEIFSFAPFTPVVSETVEIKVWIHNDEDENNLNDTITKRVFIAPKFQSIPYSTNFNENWGVYGDNPPLGGWQVIAGGNESYPMWNTNDWYRDTVSSDTVLRNVAKVSYSPVENQFEKLISPRLNCSLPGFYTLSFWHWYRDYSPLTPDSGVVLVSNNDGQSWQRKVKYSNASDIGFKVLDISSIASGSNDVRVCFLYGARNEYSWCIDDFSVIWSMSTPQLAYPTYGLETLATTINMSWLEVAGASKYVLQIAYDSTFLFPIISETVSSPTYQCSLPAYRYYWKVQAGEPYGNWSEIWYFSLLTPPPPVYGWKQLSSILVPIGGKNVKDGGALTFCRTDTNIYAFKGNNTREFYVYNMSSDTWLTKRPIGVDSTRERKIKKGTALCAVDTLVYAVKGNTNEFWVYNILRDTWIRKNSVPDKKLKGGTGLVYVAGAKAQKQSEKLNKENISTGKSEKALLTNDIIYLLKGGSRERDFFAYLVDFDTWIRKRDAPLENYNKIFKDGSAIVYDGSSRIYALKGGSKANEFYYYDIGADSWITLTNDTIPLLHPNLTKKKKVKNGGGLAIIDSTIYAIKGGGSIEFWQYDIGNQIWTGIDTIPWLHRKSVPKNGAALTASFNEVFLLKGNNTSEFWSILQRSEIEHALSNKDKSQRQALTNTNINMESIAQIANLNFSVHPNPCQEQTTIYYSVTRPGIVSIKINDATGRSIKTISHGYTGKGNHSVNFLIKDIPAGVYFITLETEEHLFQTKLIIK